MTDKKFNKTVLMLFDVSSSQPPDYDYTEEFELDEWATEGDVIDVLEKKLQYRAPHIGIRDDITALGRKVEKEKPDVILNLTESFRNDRYFEPFVAGYLELLGIPYTGSGPLGLMIAKNKGLTKEILSFHRIRVPKFDVSHLRQPLRRIRNFKYPALVKPLGLEGSDGISQESFVADEGEALSRIAFVHERLERDAIVEEYIEGRELYVGVLGNDRITVLPPRELHFDKVPEGTPKFATYQAKWNEKYRERWGIRAGSAHEIPTLIKKKIENVCRRAHQALHLRGYTRFDLRLTPTGDVYIIEANPNPCLALHEDFAQSALESGMTFEKLIERIVSLARVGR